MDRKSWKTNALVEAAVGDPAAALAEAGVGLLPRLPAVAHHAQRLEVLQPALPAVQVDRPAGRGRHRTGPLPPPPLVRREKGASLPLGGTMWSAFQALPSVGVAVG